MSQIVVGTAGHIDHGKTSLIKALTGKDTDNLAEEKERGLTIDLGFAFLNDTIAIIDVPGHEKFIRNMVAGASNIHIGLVVIAADDGVMPQTREHLDILTILGVSKGLVAMTKIDKVNDEEWISLVEMDIKELLDSIGFESISIRRINNLSGEGINEIKNDILYLSNEYHFSSKTDNFRLYVDRVFSKVGFGTVVTGTVQNGKISVGSEIEIMPSKIKTKIRGLQSNNGEVKRIIIGQRGALNITNVSKEEIKRGAVLSTINALKPTRKLVCYIKVVNFTNWKIKRNQRLRFHLGTIEVLGRIILCNYNELKKGMSDNVIIEFESLITVAMNDKIVIRSYSPMETIAGAVVLNPKPIGNNFEIKKDAKDIPLDLKQRFNHFIMINWSKPKLINEWALFFFIDIETIEVWVLENNLNKTKEGLIYSDLNFKKTLIKINSFFKNQYKLNPFRSIINFDKIIFSLNVNINWLKFVLSKMVINNLINEGKGGYSLPNYHYQPSGSDLSNLKKIKDLVIQSGYKPILEKEILIILKIKPNHLSELLYYLEDQREIKCIGYNFYISSKSFGDILNNIKDFFSKEETMSVAQFKNLMDLSRKRAIPLLEFLDNSLYTKRIENKRLKGDSLYGE